jgi:hypothetical protein
MNAHPITGPDSATSTPLRLHIERLVLEGVPGDTRDLQHLHAALEAELSRLLSIHASGGLAGNPCHLAEVPTPEVRWSAGTDPGESGRRLAQAVFAGVRTALPPAETTASPSPIAFPSSGGGVAANLDAP